jgi:signal transduction histidine kinase
MDVLLQRLFYFSRLETGNLPLFPEPANLGVFAERFAAEAGAELEQAGGRVELSVSPGPHPVSIDSEQMYRVLNNLTDNALRYAGAMPLVLSLTVESREGWECIRFSDNGQGVPPEALAHLFEQFWRADQARSAKGGEGSGLGLYIVKYIVEAHGGTIRAENSGGLAFTIRLPRREDRVS